MSTKIAIALFKLVGSGGFFTLIFFGSVSFIRANFSFTSNVSSPETIAGINAHLATARTSPSSIARPISAKPGPMTAPMLSPVRWKPKALPKWALSTESEINASRGALRIPLPIRSVTRPRKTNGQEEAVTTKALPKPAKE